MKRKFIILTAVFALLAFLTIPMGMRGQTEESCNVTYSHSDLGDMLSGSYLDASSYWKVPETNGNSAVISLPITHQPESDITVTFRIATFGSGTNPSSSNTTITAIGTETGSNWSGSGVSSYPSSSSYVNGVMTITKPQNPTTLGGLDITMGVNTGVKIFRLQSVTISYTYGGGTPQPTTYTVTYNCNGGSPCPENETGIEPGTTIYLADSPTKTDYDFAGWSDGANIYDEGDEYTVNGNVTFTAQWNEIVSGDEHWVLAELAELTPGDVFVIVGDGYAMTNNNGTSSAPETSAVTITGNEITSTVAANIKWTVSGDATNGYTFYPNGSATTWLYCNTTASSSSNNNMRVGTGNRKVFELNTNNFLLTKDNYTTRYLSIYNNTDWRGYTNTNLCPAMSFYKKVTGAVLPPSITANNVSVAYNATSGEIEYTLNNPTDNGTLSVSENEDWISNAVLNITESKVTFTTTANEANTSREGVITLIYTYGDNETVTKDVTITQAAAPVIYTTIPALFAAATNTETPVYVTFNNWVVSGVSTNGKNVFVTDNNGNGFVIYSSSDMSSTYSAGDVLAGNAVSCTLKLYNGFAELLNVDATDLTITSGGAVATANVALADLAGVNTGALLHYEGLTCSVDNNKYYLSDGTTSIQMYSALYAFDALEDGKTYNITGIYQQYNNTKEILPRSAADIEEVEVQHEEYTLTVTPSANVEIYTFVSDDPNEEGQAGALTAQVYDGTTVGLSVSAASGYMLESVLVDGVDVISQLDETGWYEFAMPTHDVAVIVTAEVLTGDQYELFSGDLVEGDYLIVYNGSAMNNTVSNDRLQYEEVTANNNVIITDNAEIVWHIAPSGNYWTIYSADANAYAASTGAKNKAQMLADGTDDMALWTVSGSVTYEFVNKKNIANEVNATLRNNVNNGTNYGFACYATSTGGALSLYKKIEYTVYLYPGSGTCPKDTIYGVGELFLPTATVDCDEYTLAGWAESSVYMAEEAPEMYTGTITPTADIVLYAVYVNASGTEWSSFPACNAMEIPYFEDFETSAPDYVVGSDGNGRTYVKPEGWIIVNQTPATTRRARPQVFYNSACTHSGDYSLRLDSTAVTAMPMLPDEVNVKDLRMEMYVRQLDSNPQLEVGVMTDLSDPSSFVVVKTIIGTLGIEHCYIDFNDYEESDNQAGSHHYIVFRNANAQNKSVNYIDDISIYIGNSCEMTFVDQEYTEDFDNCTQITSEMTGEQPECWMVVHQYVKMSDNTEPQVFCKSSYAHSGSYSLRMVGRCIYAMPKLADDVNVSDLQMNLYVMQPLADHQLEVGVMTDINDESSFIPVKVINNTTTGYEQKRIDFSGYTGGGEYIAFRNSLVDGATGNKSYNYIDDITLYIGSPCEMTIDNQTESFEDYTSLTGNWTEVEPECWTVAHQYMKLKSSSKPQVFHNRSYAHTGDYSLRMEGPCIYAMPKLADNINVGDMQMELYVRQQSEDVQLEVGVMSDLNDPSTFQTVETINTTPYMVERFVVDFGGYEGQYIAFRNSRVDGAVGKCTNNIDDITLSYREDRAAEASNNGIADDGHSYDTDFEYEYDTDFEFAVMGVENYDLSDFTVYPNPTTGKLTLGGLEVDRVEVYSQMGQMVAMFEHTGSIDITNLPGGMYILRVTLPQGVTMRKVVKR